MHQQLVPTQDLERMFLKLPIFLKDLEQFLRDAIRAAHTAHGIAPIA